MTDGYQAYRDYARRLRCWAHLLRKAKGLQDNSYDWKTRDYGRQLRVTATRNIPLSYNCLFHARVNFICQQLIFHRHAKP